MLIRRSEHDLFVVLYEFETNRFYVGDSRTGEAIENFSFATDDEALAIADAWNAESQPAGRLGEN